MAELRVYTNKRFYFKGEDLAAVRKDLGMTQDEFAKASRWSQQEQSKLERPGSIHFVSRAKLLYLKAAGVRVRMVGE